MAERRTPRAATYGLTSEFAFLAKRSGGAISHVSIVAKWFRTITKSAGRHGQLLHIPGVRHMTAARRAIHQGFLPEHGRSQSFVWKYSPVNWGR
jgi:hypothetical protein